MRSCVAYFIVLISSIVNALVAASSFQKDTGVLLVGKDGNYTWPYHDLEAKINGDIILGALHMVHERSEDKICGPIMSQGGIQALECMMYTLDKVNEGDFLPGFKIGVIARDDCDRDIYGLEQAVDFIRGKLKYLSTSFVFCLPFCFITITGSRALLVDY
jgi:hypothetical protein